MDIIEYRTERPDSIEIGTPGKGGTLKVFFDSGNREDAELRLRSAFYIREVAGLLMGGK